MFREQKRNNKREEEIASLMTPIKVEPPTPEEIAKNQEKIQALFTKRCNDEDNAFLRITEMNYFEQWVIYKDKYPLYHLRMRLWKMYIWVNYFAMTVITHPIFETLSICLIIVNSIFLALEDPTLKVQAPYLEASELIFLVMYTIEMVLKILGLGFILNRGSYMRDPWNLLDFIIVMSGYLPYVMQGDNSINLSGLRSLRVLRPLKTVTAIAKLRSLIITIFNAIPYLLEIMVVLFFVFLIFAIAGLQLFSGLLQNSCVFADNGKLVPPKDGQDMVLCRKDTCPTDFGSLYPDRVMFCAKNNENPDNGMSNFDNIMSSFLMVYVVTTMEGWTAVMAYIQIAFGYILCLYFILIVFIGGFFLINLTLAVITIKFNESQDNAKKEILAKQKHVLKPVQLPKAKLGYKESLSLARMRANPDFDIDKFTKIDILNGIYKKERYSNDPLIYNSAEPELRPVLKKKAENQTFDNLWDWKLVQGDVFLGKELKGNVTLYNPNDDEGKNPLGYRDGLKNKPLHPDVFKVEDLEDDDDDDDQGDSNSPTKLINKADFREIIKMVNQSPEEILQAASKKKNKKGNKEHPGKLNLMDQIPAAGVKDKPSPVIKSKHANQRVPTEESGKDGSETGRYNDSNHRLNERDQEFHISDDEEKIKDKVAITVEPTADAYRKLKNVLHKFKMMIQRKRQNGSLRSKAEFDGFKNDEDFQNIGGVDVAQLNLNSPLNQNTGLNTPQVNDSPNGGGIADGFLSLIQPSSIEVKEVTKSTQGATAQKEDKNPVEASNAKDATNKKDGTKVDPEAPPVPGAQKDPVLNLVKTVLANKAVMNKMSKSSKRKKKKKKEENENEITPEQQEEEKIAKYYQKRKYDYLKLEVKFMYEAIPQPVFNSILDVVADNIKKKKKEIMEENINKQTSEYYPLVYSNVELKKNKQAKKKGKDKKKERRSTSFDPNSSSGKSGAFGDSLDFDSNESEYDYDSSEAQAEIHEDKASEAKIARKKLLETNEKFIVEKPFPINISGRSEEILANMSADPGNPNQKFNQVSNLRREKGSKQTALDDFLGVKDASDKMLIEDEKSYQELKKIDHHYEFKELYMKIRSNDATEKSIAKFNWSGNQVLSQISFSLSQTDKSISSLNLQKLELWMHGYHGFFKTTQRYVREFVDSSFINTFLLASVFLNTLMMAMDGLIPDSWADLFTLFNYIFTGIFTVEMILKMYGWGLRGYFRDPFNTFDSLVVTISLIEVAINSQSGGGKSATSGFRAVRIFRIFRVLRVTRLLRSLRFMQVIIEVVKGTLEQFAYIAMLMFLFVFIFTLLGTQIFGGNFDFVKDGEIIRYNFDSFETAFYTSFMVLTTENWNEILMHCLRSSVTPVITIIYFISWIFIGNYIFLNLFLAVLLDGFENSENLQMMEEIEQEVKEHDRLHKLLIRTYEEKKRNEADEDEKATTKVMMLIEPENYKDRTVISKKQACYMVVREQDNDNDTLSDDLDINNYLKKKFRAHEVKIDPYVNSYCNKSLFYFTRQNPIRRFAATVVSHPKFETVILVLIILSSIKLVVETYLDMDNLDPTALLVLDWIDRVFNILFTLECIFKILKFGFFVPENAYLKDSWSILDFIIVVSSLIDMAVESIDLPILKVLRLLRTLRPLRFISKNQNMRIVVNSLLESMIAILNVLIVIGMVWVMFAILGNNLMQGKLGYCDGVDANVHPNFSIYGVSKQACLNKYGGRWKVAWWNFDDISQSMVTLYVLSTMEGWPKMFFSARDANDETEGPIINNSTFNALFYIVFILIGSIFFMNMFVGVICVQFSEEQRKEKAKKFYMVTEDQMRWMLVQELISTAKPNFDVMIRPKGKVRIFFFRLIRSKVFETAIMICIILNIVAMAMVYETMTDEYRDIMSYINLVFNIIFFIEMVCKLIALDFQYFTNTWNIFDFVIVILSIVDIVMDNLGSSISFLKMGPQFARVLRVLRVTRLFKLMKAKQLEGINKIIKTLIFSFPSLMNVLVLLFLIYFIFSVLACFLFKDTLIADPNYQNDLWGFQNFHIALMTLFRCSTGEDWPTFMYLYGEGGSMDKLKSQLFFLFYIFLSATVMLKVFQLVVMEQFDEYYFNPDNAINSFDDISETFDTTWNQFTIKYSGKKIKASRLIEFFYYLEEPLGYRVKEDSDDDDIVEILGSKERKKKVKIVPGLGRDEIAFHINSWKIHMDSKIFVPYRFVLHAAIANALGSKSLMFSKYEAYKTVKVKEMNLAGEILTSLAEKVKSKKADVEEHVFKHANIYANALKQYLSMKLALKTWIRYTDIFNKCPKDEVDIDSDDFELEELKSDEDENNMKKKKKELDAQLNSTLKNVKGKLGSIVVPNSTKNNIIRMNRNGMSPQPSGLLHSPFASGQAPTFAGIRAAEQNEQLEKGMEQVNLVKDEVANEENKQVRERQEAVFEQIEQDQNSQTNRQ